MVTLGERIRALRNEKQLTQEEVAVSLRVNRSTIANWELGRSEPDPGALSRLADYFHVPADYLLGRTDERRTGRTHGGYDLGEVAKNLPPDLVEAIEALPEESRHVFLRARKDLTEEDWRSIVSFIQFRLSEAEKRKKDQD